MDDHDQLNFFFFFILVFVWRRLQSGEKRRSARKLIIRFAMLSRMERRRRGLVSLLPTLVLGCIRLTLFRIFCNKNKTSKFSPDSHNNQISS